VRGSVAVGPGECWLYNGFVERNGYARMTVLGVRYLVHRLAYEAFVGPIPQGYEIDHLCFVRHCCNPDHLEPVTSKTNTMRSQSPARFNAEKTHCAQGHPFDLLNTIYKVGKHGHQRECRACKLERLKRRRRRLKEVAA
jgi:hypothetical protein